MNWRKGTTKSGACDLIWLNTGNLTPGPDTGRIDRLKALSWFGGWWCMAVLSWWSGGRGKPAKQHACMQCNAKQSASKRHSASAYTHTQRSICNFLCILSWLSWWGGWSGYIYVQCIIMNHSPSILHFLQFFMHFELIRGNARQSERER